MSQLYLVTGSDTTTKDKTTTGNRELSATFLYGGKKGSRKAAKVHLEYDPATKQTSLVVEGPRHGIEKNGKTFTDISRQVLPE